MPGLALVLTGLALASCGRERDDTPVAEPVPAYRAPTTVLENGARRIENHVPRERLRVYTEPAGRVRLLFLNGVAAAPRSDGGAAWPEAAGGRVVVFDAWGNVAEILQGAPRGAAPLGRPLFAAEAGGRLWGIEGASSLLFESGRPREWLSVELPGLVQSGARGVMAAARSVHEFALAPVLEQDPLLWLLDARGQVLRTLGRVQLPENAFLGQLHNAGWVVLDAEGGIYFAFALFPEVRKYAAAGRLRWVSRWPLEAPPPPPRLSARAGGIQPEFTAVQHGITLGPDGRIYVLARGASGAADRLVVLDQDGIWVRTADVPPADAIFADRDGRLYVVGKDGALARTGEPERAPFPDFELPALLEPSIIRLEELRGKIVVLNFWASWCGPCRQEMPLLDAYARDVSRGDVVILGLNEDVDADDGRAFVRQLGVTYPNAEGRGRLKERYRYRGLPYTVVLDRELRVVKAIYGFGGSIEPIRAAVTAASGESLQPRLRQDQQ